ncbi:MAG: NADH-quinone oxidoreductase subunit J [Anaerolineales bacterium]|nr:NADH-quinone oxidoreductase subunit J [Anaerolineales bacterium]
MTSDLIVFILLALIAVASALGMAFSQNTVYAALYLVLNFIVVAVFYLLLGAPFIAMAQITVYAGAIMVLFVFVIMLLGVQSLPPAKTLPWQKPLAVVLAILLAVESTYLLLSRAPLTQALAAPDASANTTSNLQQMALALFSEYLLPFEITSILLLVAMVGAIVLSKHEKKAGSGNGLG